MGKLFSLEHVVASQGGHRQRLIEIDRAKGFAIFLVVLGHLVPGEYPANNEWFGHVVQVIYSFHMPFFMYLSGFVMLYTFREQNSLQDYWRFIYSRFSRLAPAFLLFAVVILVGKIAMGQVLHVDNKPGNFFSGIVAILLFPGESAAKGLWFIYVLFEFYLITPIILYLFGGRTAPLVAIGALVYFAPASPLFMLDGFFEYLVFFGLGACCANNFRRVTTVLTEYRWLFLGVFLLTLLLLYSTVPYPLAKLVIGIASLPALHSLMRVGGFSSSALLVEWGLYSYAIYLMNTIAIGFTKGVIFLFTSWDNHNFLWIAPLLLFAGLYGSLWTKKFIFPHVKFLDRITT